MLLIRIILKLLSPRTTNSVPGELSVRILLCSMPLSNVKSREGQDGSAETVH